MIIERDPAMERRLQPVYVDELDKEASILVLKKRRPKYKRELDIEIPNDAIKAAVELSIRYITDKMLPDKAIDIIDEASATANIDGKSEITLRDIASVIHRKKVFLWKVSYARLQLQWILRKGCVLLLRGKIM